MRRTGVSSSLECSRSTNALRVVELPSWGSCSSVAGDSLVKSGCCVVASASSGSCASQSVGAGAERGRGDPWSESIAQVRLAQRCAAWQPAVERDAPASRSASSLTARAAPVALADTAFCTAGRSRRFEASRPALVCAWSSKRSRSTSGTSWGGCGVVARDACCRALRWSMVASAYARAL